MCPRLVSFTWTNVFLPVERSRFQEAVQRLPEMPLLRDFVVYGPAPLLCLDMIAHMPQLDVLCLLFRETLSEQETLTLFDQVRDAVHITITLVPMYPSEWSAAEDASPDYNSDALRRQILKLGYSRFARRY